MIERGEWCRQNGTGFDKFEPAINKIVAAVANANQQLKPKDRALDLHLIDSCLPEKYHNQSQQLLVTNNWIDPTALGQHQYQSLSPWFYGIYAGDPGQSDIVPTRAFNCLIKRMDTIRQSWLYQFVRREMLHQGHVSFMMDVSRHYMNREANPTETAHEIFEKQYQAHCQIFTAEHDKIKTQVPYRSFDSQWSLDHVVMQSKFSIILETYFIDPRMITLSEKTLRCLKLPRPWIVFSTKGTVQYLRELGFDVLDDVIDHSYDTVEFGIDRQVRLLDQAQSLLNFDLNPTVLKRCQVAARHNLALLDTWYRNLDQTTEFAITQAIQKCERL